MNKYWDLLIYQWLKKTILVLQLDVITYKHNKVRERENLHYQSELSEDEGL